MPSDLHKSITALEARVDQQARQIAALQRMLKRAPKPSPASRVRPLRLIWSRH